MTSVLQGGALELTADQYLLAWNHLQLGLVHWNLQPPGRVEPQRTAEESRAAQRRTWDSLRARGLAGARQLAPELEDALHLIARPAAELNGQLEWPDGKRSVVGCARGEHAAVAELSASGMRIRTTRATALPIAVAEAIPDRPMSSGTAVSVPAEVLADDQHGLTGAELERTLLRGGARPDDARRFRTMLQGPKLGWGKVRRGLVRSSRQQTRRRVRSHLRDRVRWLHHRVQTRSRRQPMVHRGPGITPSTRATPRSPA